MSQRYHVYNGDRLIAVIHAQNGERAILLACTKTDGNIPAECTAVQVGTMPLAASQFLLPRAWSAGS